MRAPRRGLERSAIAITAMLCFAVGTYFVFIAWLVFSGGFGDDPPHILSIGIPTAVGQTVAVSVR